VFQPETKLIVSTETKTDVEAEIREKIRTIQSYNWKLNNGVGTRDNALRNITKALVVIDELRKEAEISPKIEADIEAWKSKFITPSNSQS
jgi:hypothetical protein